MNLEDILTKVGLDEKEAKIYVALLDLGSEKVHEIAKKAGVKRPTAYVILEQLYAKNFVIKTYHQRRAFYSAEKPDIILRSLKEKEDLLGQALPLFHARMADVKDKTEDKNLRRQERHRKSIRRNLRESIRIALSAR